MLENNAIDEQEEYLNASQAARLAGLNYCYFLNLNAEGKGPPLLTIAGRKVYRKSDVAAWDQDRTKSLDRSGRKRIARRPV